MVFDEGLFVVEGGEVAPYSPEDAEAQSADDGGCESVVLNALEEDPVPQHGQRRAVSNSTRPRNRHSQIPFVVRKHEMQDPNSINSSYHTKNPFRWSARSKIPRRAVVYIHVPHLLA